MDSVAIGFKQQYHQQVAEIHIRILFGTGCVNDSAAAAWKNCATSCTRQLLWHEVREFAAEAGDDCSIDGVFLLEIRGVLIVKRDRALLNLADCFAVRCGQTGLYQQWRELVWAGADLDLGGILGNPLAVLNAVPFFFGLRG